MVKTKMPKVSIVIPVYNGEKYLEEAIESALKQTYKNIEIIVVNDGSIDNTEKICEKYISKIKYYKKENGGVASALNLALKKMSGDFFSWLSHDDIYLPDKIEKEVNYIIKNNLSYDCILYSDYLLIDELNNIIGLGKKDHNILKNKPEYSLLRGAVNGITLLVPKKAFDDFGFFDTSLKCTQDYDMWLKMQKKYKFIHLPCYLACTRIHSNQDSKTSPNVIKEGNLLWIKLIESVTDDRKIELEHSVYKYYQEMKKFLQDTPYNEALLHIEKKLNNIEEKAEKIVDDEIKKVSIVIPFFNREKLTIRAIKSVLNQTYKNIEIVLVDDCSTCKITNIKKLIENNKNIKYYRNKINKGPSESRNIGIKNSSGDFIAFLDSDDEFVENKIEFQLKEMIKNNSKASYTNYYTIQEKKKTKNVAYTIKNSEINEFLYNCKLATPTIMVEKKFLLDYGLKYDISINVCEDICFYLEILKYTDFLYVNKYLTNVYVDKNSCINDYSKRKNGIKNLINYIYQNSDYFATSTKELEYLFEGYMNFNFLEYNQEEKVSVFRKTFRIIVPLKIRKKLKEIVSR